MTSKFFIDLECDGLLDAVTKIHCIAVSTLNGDYERLYGPDEIDEGLRDIAIQDVLIGHNIQGFDVPVIKKLYPDWKFDGILRDTLILSRLAHPDRKNEDWAAPNPDALAPQLRGRHSLESWGQRLGLLKGDFGKDTDWGTYSDEMGEYCRQDVKVTIKLWEHLESMEIDPRAERMEHDFSLIMDRQMRNGFCFDTDAATDLYARLVKRKDELEAELQNIFPPVTVKMKTYQYWLDGDEKYRVKSDAPTKLRKSLKPGPLKEKHIPFNPGSRSQIAQAFTDRYSWKPVDFTPEGRPKVDETILASLKYAEAKPLSEYLMLIKRLGQLAEGNEAYLKLERDGKIYGRVNHLGTVTGRCSHSRPNVAQTVSVRAPYGLEFRSLFVAPPGEVLVGCDAAQLELRCLAHYMNDPEYIQEMVNGDIHSRNQAAAGLPTRDMAKVFAYAVCYGAGPHKLGQIVGGGVKEGARLRKRFLKNVPSLGKLIEAVQAKAEKHGFLRGLLGQRLPVRSEHKALNTLLQGAGATIMKVATVEMHKAFQKRDWNVDGPWGDVLQVAHIHDEVQFQVREDLAEDVGKILIHGVRATTNILNLRCPMDGAYRIGRTWADTH